MLLSTKCACTRVFSGSGAAENVLLVYIYAAPGTSARKYRLFFYGISRESKRNAISLIPVELRNTESGICCFKAENSNGVAVSLAFWLKFMLTEMQEVLSELKAFRT